MSPSDFTSDAPVSGIPEIDKRLAEALPALHAEGLFPAEMDPIPYGLKLVFELGGGKKATVNLYHSKKKGLSVVAGKGPAAAVSDHIADLLRPAPSGGGTDTERNLKRWIGTDEAGKGDYFGPLTCAAVLLDRQVSAQVVRLGATDSKRLGNDRVLDLAIKLRRLLGSKAATVTIGPVRYNELYANFRRGGSKLNGLLAWTHARAVMDLQDRGHTFDAVVIDRFASDAVIRGAMPKGLRFIARPRAEDNPAVAAASILARAAYLQGLDRLTEEHGVRLTSGAGDPVLRQGRELVRRHGADILRQVGKHHFRTTQTILGE